MFHTYFIKINQVSQVLDELWLQEYVMEILGKTGKIQGRPASQRPAGLAPSQIATSSIQK
jgi:hypothetical protein